MSRALRAVAVVAGATVLEAIRNRLLLVSLAFGIVLVGLSVAAASISLWERARLILDVGLAAASGMGSLIAVALTIASFASELKNRTAYPILARPLPRWVFVVGKYLGVVLPMTIVTGLMLLATAVTVALYGEGIPAAFWWAFPLAALEMAVVCAAALIFSTLASPVLAAIYSVGVVLTGSLSDDLIRIADRATRAGDETAGQLLRVAYFAIPDLSTFSIRPQAANDLPVAWELVGWAAIYGITYAGTLVVAAAWIFSRRRMM